MKLQILIFAALATVAWGQDRAELVGRVDQWSSRAADVDAPVADRLGALERTMREREALMSALPDDAHRPIWLLDQAADTLMAISLRMHETRLVVGLLDARARLESLHAAEEAYALADTAGGLIADRFEAQREILDTGGQLAQGDRTLNVRLAETELAVRRPLLMGRAMALQVAANGEVANADQVLALLEGVRLVPGGARAMRDVSLAIALAQRGDGASVRRAQELLRGVLSMLDAGDLLRAEAALLGAMLEGSADARASAIVEASGQPPFVDEQGLARAPLAVLALEARARVLLDGSRFEAAASALMELPTRRDLGGTPQQLEALLDDRLVALAERVDSWRGVRPEVVLRSAEALVAQDRPEDDARAIEMLEDLLGRFASEQQDAEKSGKAYTPPAEDGAARELLARLYLVRAQREPDAQVATQTRAKAIRLVLDIIESSSEDLEGLIEPAATLVLGPSGSDTGAAQRQRLLEGALRRGPSHEQADRWRLGLASLRIERDEDWNAALALAEQAMASQDASTRADATALAKAIHATRVSQDRGTVDELRSALAFARRHPPAAPLDAHDLAVRLARVLIDQGRPEAAREALDALASDRGKSATILRGRALSDLGRSAEAVAELRRATEMITPDADGPTYWLVWTELLELVDRERQRRMAEGNDEAAQTLARAIRGHLVRLRGVDAGLGGPPFSGRLAAIESGLPR